MVILQLDWLALDLWWGHVVALVAAHSFKFDG